MINKKIRVLYSIIILIPLLFFYSCGDKKRNIFNASRKQVDSNLVVINNPLTLPPFFFLPEPKSAKIVDTVDKISQSNSDAIFNSQVINNNVEIPITNADKMLLNLVGYNNAKKDIREVLDKEINSLVQKDKNFVEKIFNYISSSDSSKEDTLKANIDNTSKTVE